MADKYDSDTQEKIETTAYSPDLQDTGDLEAGTKTITATSEPTGVGNADYNKALTLVAPADARFQILRIAARLAVIIDSMTAGHLYCRVYVDAQDVDHKLFDEDWTSLGSKLDAVDTHSGAKATILGLLKDGSAHTFYFFFWVDTGNAVISAVELWEGVGTCDTGWSAFPVEIPFTGLLQFSTTFNRVGSGSSGCHLMPMGLDTSMSIALQADIATGATAVKNPLVRVKGSVATDLDYLTALNAILKSLQ